MALQLIHEDLHLFPDTCGRNAPLAARFAVPLDVDDGRKSVGFPWHVADEPVGLFTGCPAPVEEVIGAVFQAGFLGAAPIFLEHRIKVIAAVGRLDVDEVRALPPQRLPIDLALPARHVDAVHGKLSRRGGAEVDRLGIAEAVAVNLPAGRRSRADIGHCIAGGIGWHQQRDRLICRQGHADRPVGGHERLRLRNLSRPAQSLLRRACLRRRIANGGGRNRAARLGDGIGRFRRRHVAQHIFGARTGSASRQDQGGEEDCWHCRWTHRNLHAKQVIDGGPC